MVSNYIDLRIQNATTTQPSQKQTQQPCIHLEIAWRERVNKGEEISVVNQGYPIT